MKRILLILAVLFSAVTPLCSQNYELPSFNGQHSQLIRHEAYTVSYNSLTLCPDWVAWRLDKEHTYGEARRTDEFLEDPSVDGPCAQPSDYTRSGYDRGHMAPAADFKLSEVAMFESFYMSNICPQNNTLNAGLWMELEQRCRVYAKMTGTVWIAAGPVFSDTPSTIGRSRVSVPVAFYKVILTRTGKGSWKAIGFLMNNSPLDEDDDIFEYAVSVDRVEKLTGYDFFSLLPDDVEKSVEASTDFSFWKIKWQKR